MLTLKATAGGIDIEDGEYEATLLSIEEKAPTANSPDNNPWLLWTFTVQDGEDDVEMTQSTSMKFTPRANARKWAQALEGREFAEGEEVDIEALPPKDCRVVIERNERGFAKIVNVLAPRKRGGSKRVTSDSVTV